MRALHFNESADIVGVAIATLFMKIEFNSIYINEIPKIKTNNICQYMKNMIYLVQ